MYAELLNCNRFRGQAKYTENTTGYTTVNALRDFKRSCCYRNLSAIQERPQDFGKGVDAPVAA